MKLDSVAMGNGRGVQFSSGTTHDSQPDHTMKLKHCNTCDKDVIPDDKDDCPNCGRSLIDSSAFRPEDARLTRQDAKLQSERADDEETQLRFPARILTATILSVFEVTFAWYAGIRPFVDFHYILVYGPPSVTIIYSLFTDRLFRRWVLIIYTVIQVLPIGIILGWSIFLGHLAEPAVFFAMVALPLLYTRIEKALTRRCSRRSGLSRSAQGTVRAIPPRG